ncbi:MAG TPA: PilN domain-containing protein [Leptolyngbyaceae cyanobacterium]
MYSLEVNFLKDRPEFQTKEQITGGGAKKSIPVNDRLLMYAGVALGVILPAAVGGFWLWQQSETANLEKQLADVTALVDQAAAKKGNLDKILAETKILQQQTQDLSTVFNQMKPWSAMLQDVREKLPAGVQVAGISQTKPPDTPPPPPSNTSTQTVVTTPTTDKVEITGYANSFSKVNDFLLTLQRSSFFKDKDTRLVTANLIDNPIQLYEARPNQSSSSQPIPKLPQVVSFKIETYLSEKPATDMLAELESKGALGLVSRIENLKQKGVLK